MVGVRELTRSRVDGHGLWSQRRERERLAALGARRSCTWRKEVRRIFESEDVGTWRPFRDGGQDGRRLETRWGRGEDRRRGSHAAADARAMVLVLAGRM